jgi:hypothetical protein
MSSVLGKKILLRKDPRLVEEVGDVRGSEWLKYAML